MRTTFLHRTENRMIISPPDPTIYPQDDWIKNPDLTSVVGYDIKYWVRYAYPNDSVDLMSQAQRDAVDAQELSDQLDALVAEIDNQKDIGRQIIRRLIIEFNLHRQQWTVFQAAVANAGNLGDLQDSVANDLADMSSDRTFAQLRAWIRDEIETES